MELKTLLKQYIQDPHNPTTCFKLGWEYEKLGQTASASGLYLRATEFGDDIELSYESMLRMALCFEKQGDRWFMIKGLILRAISLIPNRPEAYFLLARTYERCKDWQEGYTASIVGKKLSTEKSNSITYLEYDGDWVFDFERAVCGWWIGLFDESLHLFRQLKENNNLTPNYKQSVINNLSSLSNWKSPIEYKKENYHELRYKFNGAENIEKNYSQCFQDMFVLMMTNGETNGTYLEIGCADPFYGNNTALLEHLGWVGDSIDISPEWEQKWAENGRKCEIANALEYNYAEGSITDYLQIDCDPPTISFEVLKKIPLHNTKFRVITFEHDHYADETKTIREKSRKYLQSFGYELIVSDISPDEYSPYEDWWVHPDLVDIKIINIMKDISNKVKKADNYIYNK
jgi:hypothetical protein